MPADLIVGWYAQRAAGVPGGAIDGDRDVLTGAATEQLA